MVWNHYKDCEFDTTPMGPNEGLCKVHDQLWTKCLSAAAAYYKRECKHSREMWDLSQAENKKLQQNLYSQGDELTWALRALQFYADPANYKVEDQALHSDRGRRAQKVIETVRKR